MFATWLYSDIASTPSSWPSRRMLERLDARLVRERDGGPEHAFSVQGGSFRHRCLDKLTVYVNLQRTLTMYVWDEGENSP